MKVPEFKLSLWLKLLMMALVLVPGLAQAETTSAIRGTVVGSDGQPVSSASVVVRDERTGQERQYATSESGSFYAARLNVGGPFKITVDGKRTVTIDRIALGDAYRITINMQVAQMEEIITYGDASALANVATGPSATFSSADLDNAVAFDKDIMQVISIDPRISLDQDGFSVNCAGKHPRFNSVTLDGISQNDRFGLNNNGYSTATGMPFPYDAIAQVSVELAPFDVTYGGFSACNINAVTKTGTNEWEAKLNYEFTNDNLRGTSIDGEPDVTTPGYDEKKYSVSVGGPLIQDKLFIFASYEKSDEPRFIGQGYSGSGIGTERPWLSKSDFDLISSVANNTYNYDPGGAPSDGTQENEKYMFRADWNLSDQHTASVIYNHFEGTQDRASDGDSREFEFSNHFYLKGSESETLTFKLNSQWTDEFSTEFFYSNNTMDDLQETRGPKDFGDFQISVNGSDNVVYLGADDSRQANALSTESDYFRAVGNYLWGDHVITAGFEQEELSIFNIFVQHSRGGEYDFFDDSSNNSAACATLDSQGRADDATCGTSGIDKFVLGTPSRIYYGSAGGSNVATDAAATFTNTQKSFFIQDEWYLADQDLTLTFGVRYDQFETGDSPKYNAAVSALYRIDNNANIDGVDIVMPRFGFSWEASSDLSVRGGFGLYSGGNPTVWLSNAFSNDGITNAQFQLRNFSGSGSVLDGTIPLNGTAGPGRAVPQELFDDVAATSDANASTRRVVFLDPDYKQPSEWKFALGATYRLPWYEIQMDVDYLHSKTEDAAVYVDLSQEIVGTTILGQPMYGYTSGEDNLMLTNSGGSSTADTVSVVFNKNFDMGLDLMVGYAYTQAEDINPMTSSTAGSNFGGVVTNDINNPSVGDSNYVVPHRFTLRVTYARDFFDGLTTRFTVYGYASEGQPQSFVMGGSDDLEGSGFFGRHPVYIPTGASDANVVFGSDFDQAAFFAFADKHGLKGGKFTSRNDQNADWSTRLDFRFDQELPTFVDGVKGKLFVKVFNLGNLISDKWGKSTDAEFFPQQIVDVSIDGQGRYLYEGFSDRSINDVREEQSLWEARFGIEFSF